MPHIVDLVVYPGCHLLDASGTWQVFASANTEGCQTHYRLELLAESDAPLVRIAEHCRLGGPEQPQRGFQRRCGLPPSVYRARFGHADDRAGEAS